MTARATATILASLRSGGTVFACGNGGSMAQAQHFIGELVGRFAFDRPPLRAVCLGSNPAAVTAIGNDYGYECVFSRELAALGRRGDVLVCFSTSGRSANLFHAGSQALDLGIALVAVVGGNRNAWGMADCRVMLEGDTPTVQEATLRWLHDVAREVEAGMFSGGAV